MDGQAAADPDRRLDRNMLSIAREGRPEPRCYDPGGRQDGARDRGSSPGGIQVTEERRFVVDDEVQQLNQNADPFGRAGVRS